MRYIEAPKTFNPRGDEISIFLAGGITGCPNWQHNIIELLKDTNLTFLNPRRENFPHAKPNAEAEQVIWEHRTLRKADTILFWFPYESTCPIALYELGAWSMTNKDIYVGVHPDYTLRNNVKVQTALVRPDVKLVYSLENLAQQIKEGYS